MTTRSTSHARRAAAGLVLAGAGLSIAGAGTAWAAPTVPCDTPAHPALYSTVEHAAVPAATHEVTVIDTAFAPGLAGVAAVSHPELAYVDGIGTPEGEGWRASGRTWAVEDTPAYTDYGWMRTIIERAGVPGSAAVPAVSHEETVVDEAARDEKVVDSPAVPAVAEVSHLETVVVEARDEKVVDSPAVPAVAEVSHQVTVVDEAARDETVVDEGGYAYVQKQTGKIRYKDTPSWNGEANDHGNDFGWFRALGEDRTHVVHHAAVTHQEKVVDTPASPAIPEVSHVVHHAAVTHQEKVVDTPASPAIPEVSHVVHHEAVTHTVTVVDVPEVPAVEAVAPESHRETGWTRDATTSPEGEGWSRTGEEIPHEAVTHDRHEWTRTVVDVPAVEAQPEVAEVSHQQTVTDLPGVAAWQEQVLVSNATPAGSACPTEAAAEGPTAVLGETAPVIASAHPTTVSSNPAAVPTQMLAHTGADLAVPLGAGLAFMVVGGGLVLVGRRQRA